MRHQLTADNPDVNNVIVNNMYVESKQNQADHGMTAHRAMGGW